MTVTPAQHAKIDTRERVEACENTRESAVMNRMKRTMEGAATAAKMQ